MAPRNRNSNIPTKKHVARLARERQMSKLIQWTGAGIVAFVVFYILWGAFSSGNLTFGKVNIDYLRRNQPIVQLGEDVVTTRQYQYHVRLQRQQMIGQYFQYQQYAQFGLDVTAQLQQMETSLSLGGAETLGQGVLDGLVNDLLIRQEAGARGITLADQEVNGRMQEVFGYYPNGTATTAPSATAIIFPTLSDEQLKLVTITATPTEFTEPTATATGYPTVTLTPDLTQTFTPAPTASATQAATATPTITVTAAATATYTPAPTATPFTSEAYDEVVKTSLESFLEIGITEADYRRLVESDLLRTKLFDVLTADVESTQEQVWARHILVADYASALSILEHLKLGEDFGALAAEHSTDTSNKDSGGDLGWFAPGVMVAPFEEAAFALKVGEISQPIKTDFGWHIIQVIGHEDRPLTTDEFEQAKQSVFDTWLAEARAAAEESGMLTIFDYWLDRIPVDPTIEETIATQEQAQ